jgi:hypothetical protein
MVFLVTNPNQYSPADVPLPMIGNNEVLLMVGVAEYAVATWTY